MKRVIKNIMIPNKVIGFFVFNISFALLIYVFLYHLEDTPLAYVSYLLSTYALVIFCIWFYKVCKFSNDFIKKSKLYSLYKYHSFTITKTSMYFSLTINLLFGLFKLGVGIYYTSWWFITFALYYLLLCFMRFSLVRNINNHDREYHKLKHTGIILLFLNLVLVGIIILIIRQDKVIDYNGFLIYLVAMYDFYLIINAFINVIKYRNVHSPIMASSKCINLTVALVSMISLEVAMIYQFGNNDYEFKKLMTSCLGFAVCLINSVMAVYMIMRANKHIKNDHS